MKSPSTVRIGPGYRNPFRWMVLLLSILPIGLISAQELMWRRAIGGEIDTFAAQGPGGDVYIVADDRALHSLDPATGASRWIYRPGGRLRNVLMVAPDGSIYVQNDRQELFAVTPGGTGRWKLNMGGEAASLPAAAPDGRVILPLTGGRIICVSRHGVILWKRDERAEASASPVVGPDGTAWIPLSDGRIVALDSWGIPVGEIVGRGAVSMVALDSAGRLWAGGFNGSLALYPGLPDMPEPLMQARPGTSRAAAILIDMNGSCRVFLADGTSVLYDREGTEIRRDNIAVSGGAPSVSAGGTLYVPASDGSIRVIAPERSAGTGTVELRGASVLAEPLLTDEGMLIAGGEDWILYGWMAEKPGPGWSQFRGGARRSGTFPADPVVRNRAEARRDPQFFYREKMAVSDDPAERMALVNELKSYRDDQSMRRELPWVNLLIEDLATAGTTRRVGRNLEPLQSHPVARAEAYGLMGRSEDFRQRDLLLECLRHEEDPMALAAGFRALGAIGSDWDGASMRIISARYRDIPAGGESFTLETTRALADLVRYNGDLSDPAGMSLMDSLLKSPVSSSAREEIIAVIRAIAGM